MNRVVTREILDDLPVDDIAAIRSRRDLQRVHRAMGTRSIVLRALRNMDVSRKRTGPLRVLELGAGDGSLLLAIAQELAPQWPPVHLTLLDAQPLVPPNSLERFAVLGWTARSTVMDVFDWIANPPPKDHHTQSEAHWDVIIANLFLHHFEGQQLATLLRAIAARGDRFVACEPHRAWFPLLGSHLVGAIGANAVTRSDAVLSVRAGFRGNELAAMWPDVDTRWRVSEHPAGLFSHCFVAEPMEAS
jgi:SAM-dependent methyltransferase